jgi:hypothetical protein
LWDVPYCGALPVHKLSGCLRLGGYSGGAVHVLSLDVLRSANLDAANDSYYKRSERIYLL